MSEHAQRVIGWVFVILLWCVGLGVTAAFVEGSALLGLTAISMLGGVIIGSVAILSLSNG